MLGLRLHVTNKLPAFREKKLERANKLRFYDKLILLRNQSVCYLITFHTVFSRVKWTLTKDKEVRNRNVVPKAISLPIKCKIRNKSEVIYYSYPLRCNGISLKHLSTIIKMTK